MPQVNFQDWLDFRTKTFFDADFKANRALVELPMSVTTRNTVTIIETEDALRSGFNAWVNMLRAQQATDMVCTATSVVELSDDMIAGQFIRRILRHAALVCPPYSSTATLRLSDGHWRAASVVTGLSNRSWPFTVPTVEDDGKELIIPSPGLKE